MPEDRITPGEFNPAENRPNFAVAQQLPGKAEKPYLALGVVFLLLVVAALLIFLPGKTEPELVIDSVVPEEPAPEPPAEAVATTSETTEETNPQVTSPAEAGQVSPWAESQQLNARRESQEILSKLFGVQQELEKLRAEEWASSQLEEIQSLAMQGDQTYQQRSYEEAIALYNSALTSAEQLVASSPEKATEFLERGSELLANNQIESALYELELATLLDPALIDAKQQYQKALVRESVLALEESAEKQLQEGMLEQARENFTEIKSLDSEYANIDTRIADVNAQILERDYRQAMSEGFANLSSANLTAAEKAFQKAGALKPSSEAVEQALQQVEASRINGQRQTKLDNAVAYEAAERWSDALEIYVGLLSEDSTITSAQLGKIRSEARSNLHNEIQGVLDEPLKLQSEQAWRQANRILIDARNIVDRGPLLSEQIQQLDSAVKIARTKITVALYSDSQTNVEIYRMGDLGQFQEHAVALYPGRYVLVGTRSGYRDVREELVLDGTQPRIELNILCTETI